MLSVEQAWWQDKLKEEAAARKAENQAARPKVHNFLPPAGRLNLGSISDKGSKYLYAIYFLCCGHYYTCVHRSVYMVCHILVTLHIGAGTTFCFDYLVWVSGERFDFRISVAHVPDHKELPALVTTCKQVYSRDVVCLHKL